MKIWYLSEDFDADLAIEEALNAINSQETDQDS